MPELPEVEAVRVGLARHVVGRTVTAVEVFDPRPLRRQEGGAEAFVRGLTGRTLTAAVRRGKLMWLPLDDGAALRAHLGMSGQLLVRGTAPLDGPDPDPNPSRYLLEPGQTPADLTATRATSLVRDLSARPRHLRVRLHLSGREGDPQHQAAGAGGAPGSGGAALDLVDQRMFGGLHLTRLVPTADGGPGGLGSEQPLLPEDATHIARDLLDPHLDRAAVVARVRASSRAVKTLLMDQSIVSGVGNIYADEGLWAARIHGLRPGNALGPRVLARLLDATAGIMGRALAVGGTSFDALYVDAEGAAGFFARSLAVYGRQGEVCRRCGTPLRTETIGGRSHTSCPRCQTRPRPRRLPH
ncbi:MULTISPECIES: bifunctional DNA-formamidopyrimidine glycosylase/DNA-(apurinic or apyrimidinic site) lyase [Actinomyces]|uniref:Bifunctional DNA-formamidopyrimidine glycosylase/DNA-(Apurinic or apyrimidinic site) lyase n=1 Tax=Actinomyces respiraculi TaxID=2744574 RepID=A0A7T0PWB6_9ACTO|nr:MULTISPECIES: bifunctional DNA-formamidopyrimidine glycosylase/DNA-(apurinic or apyrimidinic site) lyase [Actinomyces]QPL04685.1 bifunctional DNA-formamidopyrimidine glycosylase/DNA-(apurinic or apyrimidinic site) lyase [Actinomyces respiraculi]